MATAVAHEPEVLDELPEFVREYNYEWVKGQYQEVPPMSSFASDVASEIGTELRVFARTHARGRALTECLFHLPDPVDSERKPDVAFVSFDRWPQNVPIPEEDAAWNVVPDLAVEVVSPTDRIENLAEKLEEYFRAGVQLVWVVLPRQRLAYVFDSPDTMRIVRLGGSLSGGTVLPGFDLPLARLFPPPPA